MPRTTVLLAALALGAVMMLIFVSALVRVVRRAVDELPATDRAHAPAGATVAMRTRLFFLILGIVVGSWFFTFGLLSLALGV